MSHEAMAVVAEQRERLAERARLPWWYWVLFTLATAVLIGGTLAQEWLGGGAFLALFLPALLVYLAADRLARRARGIRLAPRTMARYPSTRLPGIVFVVAVAAALIAVVTTAHAHPVVAAAAVVVGTLAGVGAMVWMQRAVRADIRKGRARS